MLDVTPAMGHRITQRDLPIALGNVHSIGITLLQLLANANKIGPLYNVNGRSGRNGCIRGLHHRGQSHDLHDMANFVKALHNEFFVAFHNGGGGGNGGNNGVWKRSRSRTRNNFINSGEPQTAPRNILGKSATRLRKAQWWVHQCS